MSLKGQRDLLELWPLERTLPFLSQFSQGGYGPELGGLKLVAALVAEWH